MMTLTLPDTTTRERTQTTASASLAFHLYERMLLIRRFEERALDEFSKGRLFGTTHAYIGQEGNAAALFSLLDANDVIFSNHRCHGHFIAYGGDIYRLAAELMGKSTGLCGGRGGSQHICWRNFYSNGVQGGIVPCSTGMALAEKATASGQIVVVFLGDGTLGEGVVYESLNLASLWKLPILFVVENNGYAQTTPIHLALAGSIHDRFRAFGIATTEVDSTDVLAIQEQAAAPLQRVREHVEPAALILHTYRLCAHSKSDDTRDVAEVEQRRALDPLRIHGQRLYKTERVQAEQTCQAIIDDAFRRAESDPFPSESELTTPLACMF